MRSFSELIRYWREHAGLSLSRAAAKAGMTKAHLWDLETSRATNPTIKTLAGLASAYNADLPYLAQSAAAALSSGAPSPKSEPQASASALATDEPNTSHPDPLTVPETSALCEDCPPVGYPTDKTRCTPCPRRTTVPETSRQVDGGEG